MGCLVGGDRSSLQGRPLAVMAFGNRPITSRNRHCDSQCREIAAGLECCRSEGGSSPGHPQRGVAFTTASSIRARMFRVPARSAIGTPRGLLVSQTFATSGYARKSRMARARLRRFFRHGLLPQLIAFEACVRLGSVTHAAEELSLAQPTVSCMLRKLADHFGAPVVVIRDRRVMPTPLGDVLLTLCRDLFASFSRFEERRAQPAGYDRLPEIIPSIPPWPSSSPARSPSRWRQRASHCPRARRRPPQTAGES